MDLADILETASDRNLKVMDVRTVIQMLSKLKQGFTSTTTQMSQQLGATKKEVEDLLQQKTTELETHFKTQMERDIQNTISIYQQEIKDLQLKANNQERKTKLLSDIVQREHLIRQDLARRLDSVETNNAKRCAILSGIYIQGKKKDIKQQVVNFLKDALGKRPRVEDAYTLGKQEACTTVIVFESVKEKTEIFQHKGKLQDLEGRPIYLNDYLPQAINESRRRERAIVKQIETDPQDSTKTEYTSKGLKIRTSHYRKKVLAPQPGDVLELEPKELDDILSTKLTVGSKVRMEDSIFMAYGIDVKDYGTIRKAYLKTRLMHAQARHIVCAYVIPRAEKHYCQNFVDDDEHGAGSTILQCMLENDVECKAVYIVHFCGREKLGGDRLQGYLQAMESLFTQHPDNQLTKGLETTEDERRGKRG